MNRGASMHNLLERLPQLLKDRTYSAGEELAWYKDDALGVIEFCKEQGIAVLGGEVWIPTKPGPTIPTPFVYTWEANQKMAAESWSQFVGRTNEIARAYISEFAWDPRDALRSHTPVFNLALCDQTEFQRLAQGI